MSDQNVFDYDSSHPVPNLSVIDINRVKKGGGSDLFIVIADPLSADRRSLQRLLRKVELYLEFIRTEDFRRQSGDPSADNTNIVVKIHPHSDPKCFELLERNKTWVRNNNANLTIESSL